jgi:hypothetical protein
MTSWGELPIAAQEYISFIARQGGVPVTMVGVGPGRDQVIRTPMAALDDSDTAGDDDDDDMDDGDDWVGPGVLVI